MKRLMASAMVAACLALCACSSQTATPPASSSSAANGAASTGAFPARVKSCQEELTLTKAPEKVVVLDDTDLSILNQLGLLDKVVARSGKLRAAPYDDATLARLKAIPEIKSTVLDSGGTKVATETILEKNTDLVIGSDAGIDRDALRKAGIPVYSPVSFCANLHPEKATFSLVDQEIERVAALFGIPEKGQELITRTRGEVEAITKAAPSNRGSIAVLYVTPGSKEFYVYGNSGMVQPIVEANGLTNVYGDNPKRVFDGAMEDLVAKNPDSVLLLYGEGEADQVQPTFMTYAGVDKMKAVTNHKVYTMAFSLTDPPTPNSVKGATVLAGLLK